MSISIYNHFNPIIAIPNALNVVKEAFFSFINSICSVKDRIFTYIQTQKSKNEQTQKLKNEIVNDILNKKLGNKDFIDKHSENFDVIDTSDRLSDLIEENRSGLLHHMDDTYNGPYNYQDETYKLEPILAHRYPKSFFDVYRSGATTTEGSNQKSTIVEPPGIPVRSDLKPLLRPRLQSLHDPLAAPYAENSKKNGTKESRTYNMINAILF